MERQENWKTIEGFEDYMVSDKGRVWTHKRNKFLSPRKVKDGYLYVGLRKNGEQINKRVSRLVAEHFIPNPENYPEVHHRNEDKTENRIENLQWVSHDYNIEFSIAKYIVLYGPNDERCEIFNISKFARDKGLCFSHLAKVAKGEANSYMGYTREPGTKLNRKRNKPLRLISPDGEVFTFNNQKEASNFIGASQQNICNLVKGRKKSYKGWKLYPLEGVFGFINENQKIS